jgi:hypothetical protein
MSTRKLEVGLATGDVVQIEDVDSIGVSDHALEVFVKDNPQPKAAFNSKAWLYARFVEPEPLVTPITLDDQRKSRCDYGRVAK